MPGFQQGLMVEELRRLPELEELMIVTGASDLLARLRVRDDGHLRELLMDRIWRIEGVQRTETSLAIAEMEPKNVVG
ncbi:MAG: Lrp/AsnC family transcriptional regulator [Phycicoccus sp.]|nr:Lrp/AsnC family transcriptional regulator [Phycicoccus sp.]